MHVGASNDFLLGDNLQIELTAEWGIVFILHFSILIKTVVTGI